MIVDETGPHGDLTCIPIPTPTALAPNTHISSILQVLLVAKPGLTGTGSECAMSWSARSRGIHSRGNCRDGLSEPHTGAGLCGACVLRGSSGGNRACFRERGTPRGGIPSRAPRVGARHDIARGMSGAQRLRGCSRGLRHRHTSISCECRHRARVCGAGLSDTWLRVHRSAGVVRPASLHAARATAGCGRWRGVCRVWALPRFMTCSDLLP